jgi:hypothetical protein
MINNQLQSPVSGKNNMLNGQSSAEVKGESGKQQGGLFKLLMSSVQGETLNGNGGKNGGANILGGNLTLTSEKDGDGKSSALSLLSESGEGSKEEKITLSRLLDGSAETAEGTSKTEGEGSETASNDAEGDEQTEIITAAEGAPADEDVNLEGSESAKTDEDEVQAVTAEGNSSGEETSGKNLTDTAATTEGNGNLVTGDGLTGAQQQAAGSGEAAAAINGYAQVTNAGNSAKSSNPLSGLMAGQDTSANEKQPQAGGDILAEGDVKGRGRADIDLITREGLGNVKSEGLVNELRALATAQGEQLTPGKQERITPEHLDGSATAEDAKLVQEIFSSLQSGSIEQIAAEIRSMRASQARETKYSNYLASFANRQDISGEGRSLSASGGLAASSSGQEGWVNTMMPVSAMVPSGSSVSSELFDENAAVLWKEQITEYFESKDKSSAENQAAAAFARLGEVPVTNINVRRSFAQGLSQAIITAQGQGNKGADVWQKHNFVLEDGKNIQVSAREVDGVLQLKLSSSATELNKLLMEHEKEIRDLLENELELKIDLQMEGGGDNDAANFFGGSTGQQSNGKGGNSPLDLRSLRRTEEKQVEKVVPQAVRKFGYNQNEWTV